MVLLSFIPKFLVNFCDKIDRTHTVLGYSDSCSLVLIDRQIDRQIDFTYIFLLDLLLFTLLQFMYIPKNICFNHCFRVLSFMCLKQSSGICFVFQKVKTQMRRAYFRQGTNRCFQLTSVFKVGPSPLRKFLPNQNFPQSCSEKYHFLFVWC